MNIKRLLLISLLSVCQSVWAQSTVQVEPNFWWVGMKHSNLQLMINAKGVANLTPAIVDINGKVISMDDVHIQSWNRLDSDNYLFVDLEVRQSAQPQFIYLSLTAKNKPLSYSFSYELKQRDNDSAARNGFSNRDSIYLITPDRFANGDASNDELPEYRDKLNRQHPGGRHGGDIQGIINSLDYIAQMGFTQIWLNPVLENAMEHYSYHGYSTTNYYQVDPRYGSNELYKSLADKAKQKGVGLIKDVILNHIGSDHKWMSDLPSEDWINNKGKFVPTTHLREALHDPHAAEQDKRGFDSGWFVPTMPDLNQKNPFLAEYLIQNAIWWIEYAGLSGIRLDTYSYPDKAFLSHWNDRVLLEYPKLNIVGEEWTTNPAITAYWQRGSKRHDDYVSNLPSVFDFPLQKALVDSLNQEETWGTGWISTYTALANDFLYGEPNNLVTFADNHDMSRIYSQLDEDVELTNMALTFIATTRGIPQFYYGSEILMEGSDDHGEIRSDFPGGWLGDKVNAFSGKGLKKSQRNTQQYLKKLLNFRKHEPLLHDGKLIHYARENGVYSYFRYVDKAGDKVFVALNKSDKKQTISLSKYSEILSGKTYQAINAITNNVVPFENTIEVSPRSSLILKLVKTN